MAIKSGIIFAVLVLGCVAFPTPDTDFSRFFENVVPDSQGRLVGGTVAPTGAHPHMVSMATGSSVNNFICGGSILTRRTILTAAHCIRAVYNFGGISQALRLIVGTNSWNRGGYAYRASSNVTHQHYVHHLIKNDIGVLYTTTNIVFGDLVKPIEIDFEYADANIQSRAAGWGRTRDGGSMPTQLLQLDVSTISGEECVRRTAAAFSSPIVEPHIELCTVHPVNSGFGMCNGDSGSALVRLDRGTQIGVVSWGLCGSRGVPDMFVRLSAYKSWLEEYVRA